MSIEMITVVNEDNDQPGRACCYCAKPSTVEDLRPYGPNGAWVGFPCAMSSPERKAETQAALDAVLDGCGPNLIIGGGAGPRPAQGGQQ